MDDRNQGGEPSGGWQFHTENPKSRGLQTVPDKKSPASTGKPLFNWTASEYIEHKKGFGWYLVLILSAVAITVLMFWITRDILSSIIILILIGVFAVIANRKPRVVEYRLDTNGLAIGNKFYAYSNFKSFTLEETGPVKNITFLPLKRFMPSVSVYFDPQDELKIATAVSQFLPFENRPPDAVDHFMRRIRF